MPIFYRGAGIDTYWYLKTIRWKGVLLLGPPNPGQPLIGLWTTFQEEQRTARLFR